MCVHENNSIPTIEVVSYQHNEKSFESLQTHE